MKTVNVLPEWYLRQNRQKKRLRVHLGIMVLLGCAIVGWTFVAQERLALLNHQRTELAARAAGIGNPQAQLAKQQIELQRLRDLQSAYQELHSTIPMSAVIQQVQNDMTRGMSLSKVQVAVTPKPVEGSAFADSRRQTRYHDVAEIEVVGVAPNDVQIAQLIGKMSNNPVFTDVALNYTRTMIIRDYSARCFEIKLKIDLDRFVAEDSVVATGEPLDVR